ncbi:unnamed protein product [Amoebophrya sp. A120]|nr:unnamed protein product [Amoebophrya sp. A120]|eukprot:GSA120T00000923001.1
MNMHAVTTTQRPSCTPRENKRPTALAQNQPMHGDGRSTNTPAPSKAAKPATEHAGEDAAQVEATERTVGDGRAPPTEKSSRTRDETHYGSASSSAVPKSRPVSEARHKNRRKGLDMASFQPGRTRGNVHTLSFESSEQLPQKYSSPVAGGNSTLLQIGVASSSVSQADHGSISMSTMLNSLVASDDTSRIKVAKDHLTHAAYSQFGWLGDDCKWKPNYWAQTLGYITEEDVEVDIHSWAPEVNADRAQDEMECVQHFYGRNPPIAGRSLRYVLQYHKHFITMGKEFLARQLRKLQQGVQNDEDEKDSDQFEFAEAIKPFFEGTDEIMNPCPPSLTTTPFWMGSKDTPATEQYLKSAGNDATKEDPCFDGNRLHRWAELRQIAIWEITAPYCIAAAQEDNILVPYNAESHRTEDKTSLKIRCAATHITGLTEKDCERGNRDLPALGSFQGAGADDKVTLHANLMVAQNFVAKKPETNPLVQEEAKLEDALDTKMIAENVVDDPFVKQALGEEFIEENFDKREEDSTASVLSFSLARGPSPTVHLDLLAAAVADLERDSDQPQAFHERMSAIRNLVGLARQAQQQTVAHSGLGLAKLHKEHPELIQKFAIAETMLQDIERRLENFDDEIQSGLHTKVQVIGVDLNPDHPLHSYQQSLNALVDLWNEELGSQQHGTAGTSQLRRVNVAAREACEPCDYLQRKVTVRERWPMPDGSWFYCQEEESVRQRREHRNAVRAQQNLGRLMRGATEIPLEADKCEKTKTVKEDLKAAGAFARCDVVKNGLRTGQGNFAKVSPAQSTFEVISTSTPHPQVYFVPHWHEDVITAWSKPEPPETKCKAEERYDYPKGHFRPNLSNGCGGVTEENKNLQGYITHHELKRTGAPADMKLYFDAKHWPGHQSDVNPNSNALSKPQPTLQNKNIGLLFSCPDQDCPRDQASGEATEAKPEHVTYIVLNVEGGASLIQDAMDHAAKAEQARTVAASHGHDPPPFCCPATELLGDRPDIAIALSNQSRHAFVWQKQLAFLTQGKVPSIAFVSKEGDESHMLRPIGDLWKSLYPDLFVGDPVELSPGPPR